MRLKSKPNVLVTVLTWNHKSFTELCLKYLLLNTAIRHKILVIDQGSTDGTLELLRDYKDKHQIELVENGKNLGIAASINIGMKIAVEREMDFCFFSNDVVAGDNWLEALQDGVYKSDIIGGGSPYIGPEATYDEFVNMEFRHRYRNIYWPRLRSDPFTNELEGLVDELHGGDFQNFTENWAETRKDVPPLFEWFSMVMYIKKSTIERVGYFDEQFYPSHREDLDYMVRMNNQELYRVGVTGSYVFHFSTITTRSEWRDGDKEMNRLANENEMRFNKKWRVFLPYNQRRNNIPDGDKYEPKEVVPFLPFPVSQANENRAHNKWYTWDEYNKLNKGAE